ncbi:hypothetical protein D3C71_1911090 [compost metagenome]
MYFSLSMALAAAGILSIASLVTVERDLALSSCTIMPPPSDCPLTLMVPTSVESAASTAPGNIADITAR